MRPHGTRARYVLDRCRCDPCRGANLAYATARDRRKVYPELYGPLHTTVPAGPVRAHVRALLGAGASRRGIAIAAGMRRNEILDLIRGRMRSDRLPTSRRPRRRYVVGRIRRDKAERLLALTPSDCLQPHSLVAAAPTWRLIEDLLADGYTKAWIARALGAKMPALQLRRDRILVATAARVRALYVATYRSRRMATPEERRAVAAERRIGPRSRLREAV